MPEMPAAGSMKPDCARFILRIDTLASSGVWAAFSALMGPALPSIFRLPLAGSSADILNGKDEAREKFVTSILTLSYTCGLSFDPARETVRRPSSTFSLATDRFGLPPEVGEVEEERAGAGDDEAAGFGADVLFPPRLEKFH